MCWCAVKKLPTALTQPTFDGEATEVVARLECLVVADADFVSK